MKMTSNQKIRDWIQVLGCVVGVAICSIQSVRVNVNVCVCVCVFVPPRQNSDNFIPKHIWGSHLAPKTPTPIEACVLFFTFFCIHEH